MPRPDEQLEDFWTHVDDTAGVNRCWPWSLRRSRRGYGLWHVNGRQRLAHELAWELTFGPIQSPRLSVGHHCDNPPCCNPVHLYLGTSLDTSGAGCTRRPRPSGPDPKVTAVITARVVRLDYVDAA